MAYWPRAEQERNRTEMIDTAPWHTARTDAYSHQHYVYIYSNFFNSLITTLVRFYRRRRSICAAFVSMKVCSPTRQDVDTFHVR